MRISAVARVMGHLDQLTPEVRGSAHPVGTAATAAHLAGHTSKNDATPVEMARVAGTVEVARRCDPLVAGRDR
jgi:hypothetical protein